MTSGPGQSPYARKNHAEDLGSGTADSTKVLHGDLTWQTASSGVSLEGTTAPPATAGASVLGTSGTAAHSDHTHQTGTHTHAESDVTSLTTDLAAKVAKSTVTAKGDLIVATGSAAVTNQPVGANGLALVADSTQTTGIKWATPAPATHTHAESDVTNLTTDLAALPKGHQASASTTTTVTGVGATQSAFSGLGSVAFTAVAGRRYKVTVKAAVTQSVSTNITILNVRDGGASAPTNTSTSLDLYRFCGGATAGVSTGYAFTLSGLTAGTHTLGLFGGINSGTVTLGDGSNTSYLVVEDIGT